LDICYMQRSTLKTTLVMKKFLDLFYPKIKEILNSILYITQEEILQEKSLVQS
jgi:hypothetical protein